MFLRINILYFFLLSDGDLGGTVDVRRAYMKQKHRMLWERRHGPVGTGMKARKLSDSD